jgi:hypothetical protein
MVLLKFERKVLFYSFFIFIVKIKNEFNELKSKNLDEGELLLFLKQFIIT